MAFDLTMDALSPTRLAEFWKLALGYVDEPPPAPFTTRLEWLESFNLPPGEMDEDGAWLHDPSGTGPRLSILQVPEGKVAKNRLHIDIRVPTDSDPDVRWSQLVAAAERLVAAGGTVLREDLGHHLVMADPEGNEFCIAAASR